jgi:hypothetical protein
MTEITKHYFDLLEVKKTHGSTTKYAKIEVLGYSEIGFIMGSILTVCRQALEGAELNNQFANNLDYARLLEVVNNLIPHAEFELLDHLHIDVLKNSENDTD